MTAVKLVRFHDGCVLTCSEDGDPSASGRRRRPITENLATTSSSGDNDPILQHVLRLSESVYSGKMRLFKGLESFFVAAFILTAKLPSKKFLS